MIGRRLRVKPRRRRVKGQRRAPALPIEPSITQQHLVWTRNVARYRAAARPAQSTDLEQIGEIAVELNLEPNRHLLAAEIVYGHPLIGDALPEKERPQNVQGVLLQDNLPVGINIGIGQVDRIKRVVVTQV